MSCTLLFKVIDGYWWPLLETPFWWYTALYNNTVSNERKYTLAPRYSKCRGARGKVGGEPCHPSSVADPLLSIWPPSVLSTRHDKSVYFLLGETVGLEYSLSCSLSLQFLQRWWHANSGTNCRQQHLHAQILWKRCLYYGHLLLLSTCQGCVRNKCKPWYQTIKFLVKDCYTTKATNWFWCYFGLI